MGIQNFPAQLQPIIQQGYLEHAFEEALHAKLAYRAVADREPFEGQIGETKTKTRTGLRPPATTPLAPASNTNFDNGMTPTVPGVEQYTLTLNAYGDTVDLNVVTQKVGIANQFIMNARQLAEQAARTLDTLAVNALLNTYLGGNTRVRVTLGSAGTTVSVDDIRGFQSVFTSTGVLVAVSPSNTLTVSINGTAYTVTGATPDGTNVSSAPGGISGTLTTSTNVSVANGTAGNPVVASIAPAVIRPNNRATTAALVSGDTLTMVSCVLQAATQLRLNNVPEIDGAYNFYLDAQQLQGLFNDNAFQTLFRGAYRAPEYRQGEVFELVGVRFIPTNLAPQQNLGGLNIRRGLVCGAGALIEADLPTANTETDNPLAEEVVVDGVRMITRAPMDRLQQIVAQSWEWIGAFCTPSDITANPTVLPTATNSAWKRAVVIESS